MKKEKMLIFGINIILVFLTASVFAKEYRFDKAKAVFDIPDSYIVATQDNIPDSVIQHTGYSKQQILDYLTQKTTILVGYKNKHMIEITSSSSKAAQNVVDNLRIPEEKANDPKALDLIKKQFQDEKHWKVSNVSFRKIGNAGYFIVNHTASAQGQRIYIKYYSTIKNSITIGISGQSLIDNNNEMNKDLEYIIQNVKYDNEKNTIVNPTTNTQTTKPNLFPKKNNNNFLGKTLGKAILIAIIAAVVQLWKHFKNKKG